MKRWLVIGLVVASAAVYGQTFDFKGIRLGARSTPDQVTEKLGVACGLGFEDAQVCNGRVTVAGEWATLNLVISPSGVVRRMAFTLDPDSFEIVAGELEKKFGKPAQRKVSALQNAMGTSYEQQEWVWRGADRALITYRKYAGTTQASSLNFSTREDREKLESLRRSKRSNDL